MFILSRDEEASIRWNTICVHIFFFRGAATHYWVKASLMYIRIRIRNFSILWANGSLSTTSVSYTHLDVYKRQVCRISSHWTTPHYSYTLFTWWELLYIFSSLVQMVSASAITERVQHYQALQRITICNVRCNFYSCLKSCRHNIIEIMVLYSYRCRET